MKLLSATRRTLLGLIGGLAIFRPARAAVPDAFTLAPQLAVGQRLRYGMRLEQRRNGALAHRTQGDVQLEVLAAEGEGWRLRWVSERSVLLDADPQVRPLLDTLLGLWDGVPVDFLVDGDGHVLGLAEPRALRAKVGVMVEGLLAQLAADPARAPLLPYLQAALAPIAGSEVYVTQVLLKEAMVLLGAMGRDYRVGEALEVRSRIPSPLGSGEIPILGHFTVRAVDAASAEAELGWLMVVDRHTAARLVASELQGPVQALADAVEGAPDAAALVSAAVDGLDFDERADFHVDTATAWPRRVRHVRRSVASGAERLDSIELTQLPG